MCKWKILMLLSKMNSQSLDVVKHMQTCNTIAWTIKKWLIDILWSRFGFRFAHNPYACVVHVIKHYWNPKKRDADNLKICKPLHNDLSCPLRCLEIKRLNAVIMQLYAIQFNAIQFNQTYLHFKHFQLYSNQWSLRKQNQSM